MTAGEITLQAEQLGEIVTGWDLEDKFSQKAILELVRTCTGAPKAVTDASKLHTARPDWETEGGGPGLLRARPICGATGPAGADPGGHPCRGSGGLARRLACLPPVRRNGHAVAGRAWRAICLDYTAIPATASMLGIKRRDLTDIFPDLRVMEVEPWPSWPNPWSRS